MAEVVEINIISRVVLDNDILFSFIHEQVEIQGNRTIEAMNNWAYEGLHRLGSKEDIQNLLDTKIVCITQKAVDGYVGLNIELHLPEQKVRTRRSVTRKPGNSGSD